MQAPGLVSTRAGCGASELDERVEAARTARTGSELAALTADLPTARPRARELVRIDQRFGEVARADLGMGADLTLVIRPGIEVDVDDLTVRMGDVNVRPAAGDGAASAAALAVVGRVTRAPSGGAGCTAISR